MQRIFFAFLFSLVVITSEAQHFPPVGAVWKFDYHDGNIYPYSAPYYPKAYWSVVKDTLITGKLCRKLVNTNLVDINDSCGSTKVSFFYESNDSLYQYSCLNKKFQLYFNFKMNVGDTISLPQNYYLQYIDTLVMEGFNDSLLIKKYHLVEKYPGHHRLLIYDKIINPNYLNSIDEYFDENGIMEWSGWQLRCYSDSFYKDLRYSYLLIQYSCDYYSYRPIQPPFQFGTWTYSLPRTSPGSPSDLIKIRSQSLSLNGKNYSRLTPFFNGKDSLPEGNILITSDSIGMLFYDNGNLYRFYDFSLNVGDTGIGYCGPFCKPYLALNAQDKVPNKIMPFKYRVKEVYYDRRDSNYFGGWGTGKKMIVTPVAYNLVEQGKYANWQFNGPIYEGVGCTISLFGEPSNSPAVYDTGFLRCYSTDFDLSFLNYKTVKRGLPCDA
ncbi:MAG: hypothetical protein ACHQK8_02590, partial [Bacteroidia bacterium]